MTLLGFNYAVAVGLVIVAAVIIIVEEAISSKAPSDAILTTIIAGATLVSICVIALEQICSNICILVRKGSRENGTDTQKCKDNWFNLCCCTDTQIDKIKEAYKAFFNCKCPVLIHTSVLIIMIGMCIAAFRIKPDKYLQETMEARSATSVNLFGLGVAHNRNDREHEPILWTPTDVATPDEENTISFIATKRVKIRQQKTYCSESSAIKKAHCKNGSDCPAGHIYRKGHGVTTGNCTNGMCQVLAWCPIDYKESQEEVTVEELVGVGNYDMLITNNIRFHFDDLADAKYSNYGHKTPCIYNTLKKRDCPYFPIEYIVRTALNATQTLTKFPEHGCTIAIQLEYKCEYNKPCLPTYEFSLLDSNRTQQTGYSYTSATYSKDDKNSRTLFKDTGLQFHIQVKATIRYFTSEQLLLVAVTGFAVLKFTEPLANFISHIFFFVYYISCCWCNHPCLPKEQNERSSPTPEEETTLLLSSQD